MKIDITDSNIERVLISSDEIILKNVRISEEGNIICLRTWIDGFEKIMTFDAYLETKYCVEEGYRDYAKKFGSFVADVEFELPHRKL
jgi:hypothetical protein